MTIEFGDWRLSPRDSHNWELEHRHVARATGKNGGGSEPTWHRLGRFYQYNTLSEALRYATDCELKELRGAEAEGIWEALREYERITRELEDALLAALSGHSGPKA